MGWDIDLVKDGKVVEVAGHQTGSNLLAEMKDGDLVPVDRTKASCCITYNYFPLYQMTGLFVRDLNGKSAKETIGILRSSVDKLGTTKYEDYWAPTPGNAGAALQTLLNWAEQHPDATWIVT